jgi:predicted nucleic acid-binding protein
MTSGLADTSVFIALEGSRFTEQTLPERLAISVITVAELRAGVLAARDPATRDQRLRTYAFALEFEPLPINNAVAEAWASLRVALRDHQRRMGVNDSWIAAIAITHGLPVVTQDNDFEAATGLGLSIIRV